MARVEFTIIDETRPRAVTVSTTAESVRLSPEELRTSLGWELKPEGLCKGSLCVPHHRQPDLVTADGIELARFAALIERPLALDVEERVGVLGASARARGQQLLSLQAPDFTLPDLDGHPHTLSGYRGRRVLLVAHASW
jgi:hypothetical protein